MVPWCSDTIIIFPGISNYLVSISTEIFEINMSSEYGLDAYLFRIIPEDLSYIENMFLERVCEFDNFFASDVSVSIQLVITI